MEDPTLGKLWWPLSTRTVPELHARDHSRAVDGTRRVDTCLARGPTHNRSRGKQGNIPANYRLVVCFHSPPPLSSHHLSLQTIVPNRPALLSKTNIWRRHLQGRGFWDLPRSPGHGQQTRFQLFRIIIIIIVIIPLGRCCGRLWHFISRHITVLKKSSTWAKASHHTIHTLKRFSLSQ